MRGGDTDTNAAITGTLLGAAHGIDAMPCQPAGAKPSSPAARNQGNPEYIAPGPRPSGRWMRCFLLDAWWNSADTRVRPWCGVPATAWGTVAGIRNLTSTYSGLKDGMRGAGHDKDGSTWPPHMLHFHPSHTYIS